MGPMRWLSGRGAGVVILRCVCMHLMILAMVQAPAPLQASCPALSAPTP